MRVVLFTGKGGVGKTTVAAATAAALAERGRKTLVVSTDAAHSLGDALALALGPEPVEVDTGLFAAHVDTHEAFQHSWAEIRRYLSDVVEAGGGEPLDPAELSVFPGADDVLALLAVRDHAATGRFDAVVVDCAPTAETLRLLALPEVLSAYTERLFSPERRLARSLRPVLSRVAGMPMPTDSVLNAVDRLTADLADCRRLLADQETTSVRLVITPESMVLAEARRTATALALHGYRVGGVVVNRVFGDGDDPWRAAWQRSQHAILQHIDDAFGPLPVRRIPFLAGEPVGLAALRSVGADLYGEDDPVGGTVPADLVQLARTSDGYRLAVELPFATRDDVDLARSGDELVITIGSRRRLLTLPSGLRRCRVTGAAMRDGRLEISFEPDPDQWVRR